MYEKFTDRARKVMQLANTEAHHLRHEYIGSEHILLGLVKEGSGVAAHVLKGFSLDLSTLRTGVERHIATGPEPYTLGPDDKLPHHPDANRIIGLAIEESVKLGDSHVGTEHILLGLLRNRSGLGCFVLAGSGLDLDAVRNYTVQLLGCEHQPCGVEHVPCGICGRPSSPVDCRCDNCWEVEKRLADYIESPAGKAFVLKTLYTSECSKAGGRDSKSQRVGSIPTGRAN